MVFRENARRRKKKKFLRKRDNALSKMPITRRKEKTSHNMTKVVTKCNYMTSGIGEKRQKQTDIFYLNIMKNEIIIAYKT